MQLKAREDDYIKGHIDQAELQNGKQFRSYQVLTGEDTYHFVWKKEWADAIRLYQFEEITKHIQYVKDGVIPNTAIATPMYHRCLQSMLAPGQEW